ncbi:MAG: flagellar motor protein MotA [Pseudomonadota bacterium]
MTGTRRFLVRMGLFLIGVLAVAGVSYPVLVRAFEANPALNAMILVVLLLGIIYIFRQVTMLQPEITWLESFRRGQVGLSNSQARLLAPMATMLGERKGRLTLSATATRALLDTIGARLDEGRDIARYLIGLMILLGLLGTFYGLMLTVGSVGDVVGRLTMGGGDAANAFEDLKRGLSSPLAAMGTAFGSSLFGLAGSLVLGFLDLQAGQAQNRFYNELEEWLSTQTRLGGGGSAVADGEQSVPAFIQALLEQTADSLEGLQRTLARGEDSRMQANQNLMALTDKLSVLADQMRAEQSLMLRLAENQTEMKPLLARLADQFDKGGMGFDEASKGHIRNLDLYLARLLEDTTQGRAQIIQDVRSEIRLLARTIAALAEEGER